MRECLKKEVSYRTSRSSGPGGQHVNKTESRVELLWNLSQSACLTEKQKHLAKLRLSSRLSSQGVLIITSEKHRSQHRNRQEVTERFLNLVTGSVVPSRKRHPTRPTRSSIENRIRSKKIRGELKRTRKNPPDG